MRRIKSLYPNTLILVFTSLKETVYVLSILIAGARGFLSKEISGATMIKAIDKVYNDGYHITSNFENKININIDLQRSRNRLWNTFLLRNRGVKISCGRQKNIEIAATLKINQKTVNTYKSRLMKKLEVDNYSDLYQQAINLELI